MAACLASSAGPQVSQRDAHPLAPGADLPALPHVPWQVHGTRRVFGLHALQRRRALHGVRRLCFNAGRHGTGSKEWQVCEVQGRAVWQGEWAPAALSGVGGPSCVGRWVGGVVRAAQSCGQPGPPRGMHWERQQELIVGNWLCRMGREAVHFRTCAHAQPPRRLWDFFCTHLAGWRRRTNAAPPPTPHHHAVRPSQTFQVLPVPEGALLVRAELLASLSACERRSAWRGSRSVPAGLPPTAQPLPAGLMCTTLPQMSTHASSGKDSQLAVDPRSGMGNKQQQVTEGNRPLSPRAGATGARTMEWCTETRSRGRASRGECACRGGSDGGAALPTPPACGAPCLASPAACMAALVSMPCTTRSNLATKLAA